MLKKLVPRWLRQMRNVRYRGGHLRLNVPDRRVLEDEVLPYYAERGDIGKVLDVGTAWFTKWYHKLFKDTEYWTIERYEELAKYGAPNHKAISLLEAGEHFDPASFDLIILNGVFGWGLDAPDEIAEALDVLADLLADGGHLIIGWDDNDNNRPAGMKDSVSKDFEPFTFPPTGKAELPTTSKWQHVFSFYQRKARS